MKFVWAERGKWGGSCVEKMRVHPCFYTYSMLEPLVLGLEDERVGYIIEAMYHLR
jgi:hypothetical protein